VDSEQPIAITIKKEVVVKRRKEFLIGVSMGLTGKFTQNIRRSTLARGRVSAKLSTQDEECLKKVARIVTENTSDSHFCGCHLCSDHLPLHI
jgi:hypothetical protein